MHLCLLFALRLVAWQSVESKRKASANDANAPEASALQRVEIARNGEGTEVRGFEVCAKGARELTASALQLNARLPLAAAACGQRLAAVRMLGASVAAAANAELRRQRQQVCNRRCRACACSLVRSFVRSPVRQLLLPRRAVERTNSYSIISPLPPSPRLASNSSVLRKSPALEPHELCSCRRCFACLLCRESGQRSHWCRSCCRHTESVLQTARLALLLLAHDGHCGGHDTDSILPDKQIVYFVFLSCSLYSQIFFHISSTQLAIC